MDGPGKLSYISDMAIHIPQPGNELREIRYLLSLLPLSTAKLKGKDIEYHWDLLQTTLEDPKILQRVRSSRAQRTRDMLFTLQRIVKDEEYLSKNPKRWEDLWRILQRKLEVYGALLLKFPAETPE